MKVESSLYKIKLAEHSCLTTVLLFMLSCLLLALHRKELQELQNLYKQNTEHTAQQAELIQQLQALNMDTQKVLRNQEDAHTAETISYQKVCSFFLSQKYKFKHSSEYCP